MERSQVIIGGQRIDVWVADSLAEQEAGLMDVPPLSDEEGMLFAFDPTVQATFALKGVDYALDVLFIAQDGTIASILPLDPAGPTSAAGPPGTRWVLELRAGSAKRLGVTEGDTVIVTNAEKS